IGYRSGHITKDRHDAPTKIVILDFAIVIQRDDNFARIRFAPGDIKTKIPTSTVAPRYSDDIGAKHSTLMLPCIGAELGMFDLDTAFTVIDHNETGSKID